MGSSETIAAFQERNVIETQSLFKKRPQISPFPSGPYMLTCILSKTSDYLVNRIIDCEIFRPLCVVQNNSNGSETRA